MTETKSWPERWQNYAAFLSELAEKKAHAARCERETQAALKKGLITKEQAAMLRAEVAK